MLTLGFALHNHQPVGNFDHVLEDAHRQCYRPFLDLVRDFPAFRFSMHWSGPLLDWLEAHHRETVDLLADMASRGQVRIMGGAYYEPILAALPDRDRLGQIEMMSEYVERRFGTRPEGMWLAERVWEQGLVKSIADAGIRFTAVDDAHFLYAGIEKEALTGYLLAEDRGRKIGVFPIDEQLRYDIPFATVDKLIAYLREREERLEDATIVYADDGEKFGTWPGTHQHCYKDGWLRAFIEAALAEESWLRIAPLGELYESREPVGHAYLPDSSYREMMEWTLPVPARRSYESARRHLVELGDDAGARLLRGASWRSFFRKYPEARRMYGRMLDVSAAVDAMAPGASRQEARRELYMGQCNCSYWHGVFGGLYLPHLRFATYQHLIRADAPARAGARGVTIRTADVDLDGHDEVVLSNDYLSLVVAPRRGGRLIELDLRPKAANLTHTLSRRPEFYHDELSKERRGTGDDVETIHASVHTKEEGLEELLIYDAYSRDSLIDHFLPDGAGPSALDGGEYGGIGRLPWKGLTTECLKTDDSWGTIELQGTVTLGEHGTALRVSKSVGLEAGGRTIRASWRLAPQGDPTPSFRFASEWTFTLLAGEAPDRYFRAGGERLGNLSSRLACRRPEDFAVVDEYLDVAATFAPRGEADVWTFPIWTVSSSEGGCEKIFQGATVVVVWPVVTWQEPSVRFDIEVTIGDANA